MVKEASRKILHKGPFFLKQHSRALGIIAYVHTLVYFGAVSIFCIEISFPSYVTYMYHICTNTGFGTAIRFQHIPPSHSQPTKNDIAIANCSSQNYIKAIRGMQKIANFCSDP